MGDFAPFCGTDGSALTLEPARPPCPAIVAPFGRWIYVVSSSVRAASNSIRTQFEWFPASFGLDSGCFVILQRKGQYKMEAVFNSTRMVCGSVPSRSGLESCGSRAPGARN